MSTPMDAGERASPTSYIRAQDFVWVLLFASLVVFGPERDPRALIVMCGMAVFQLVEPRLSIFASQKGTIVSCVIKLLLGYLVLAYTDGLSSSYYFILLFPVISAATSLGLVGFIIFTLLSCGAYLSFLLFIPAGLYVPDEEYSQVFLRVAFVPVVGYLTYDLANAIREKARNFQNVAEQLAGANKSLREAEAAVRRADRLAALGQLTAGLAHELRNPLSTIKNSAEMLNKVLPSDNELGLEMAGYISSEVDRTNSLITRFLQFARPTKLQLEPTDVSQVIDRAIVQIEREKSVPGITFYKNYSPDVRPVPLDAEMMERVFYNLMLNAAQASPAKGMVSIKTRAVDSMVEVSVIDTGSGIDPKHAENIFNPFFTTKSAGVGLGLAIVNKIVDEHNGKIVVESQPGEGSTFRVYLPVKQVSE